MNLKSFFEVSDDAPVSKAFQALRCHLNRHADSLSYGEYSPWTMCLGKGGPSSFGGMYPGPEKSIYRHCMDVASFALWLFFHAWQSGKIPLSKEQDPVPALRILFAIAFSHDADKLRGGKSRSPSLEDVRYVYKMLEMQEWAGQTVEEMHAAVSHVENRGNVQAVFGTVMIDHLTEKLAEMIYTADNLISRSTKEGGSPGDFVRIYNGDAHRLHSLYGTPDQSLRYIRFRNHPIVLHRLFGFMEERLYDNGFYPLLLIRQGEWLDVALSESIETEFLATWLDEFEESLLNRTPSLQVSPTTGKVTLFHVHGAADVLNAVKKNDRQVQSILLRFSLKDWNAVIPLAGFWVKKDGPPFGLLQKDEGKSFCPVFRKTMDTEVSSDHPIWIAASIAAILNEGKNVGRLLSIKGGIIKMALEKNGIDWKKLSPLTLRTAVSLQASLVIEDEDRLMSWLDEIHGPWDKPEPIDPGTKEVVDSLRNQIGIEGDHVVRSLLPYEESPTRNIGFCLLCGNPTERMVETSSMKLAGIKKSSFSNRIGHKKSLDSQSGANYICPACERIQGLFLQVNDSRYTTPMLVSTPVQHLLDTQTKKGPDLLRSFDAVSRENRKSVFPWEGDTRFSEPLMFEERQIPLGDVIDQMYRFAVYAATSGEPVHSFIASQRNCKSSFLYEETPALLKEILGDITNEEGGINRKNLDRLIRRLDLFRGMLRENGMNGLQSIPEFGWWAVAHVYIRALSNKKVKWESISKTVVMSRKEFPVNEYDRFLETLVKVSICINLPRWDGSTNDFTFMLRGALETWQSQSIFEEKTIKFAIMNRLRSDVSRRIKNGRVPREEDLMEFSEAAIAIFQKGEAESDMNSKFLRFLFSAYEGGYRYEANKEWKKIKELKESAKNRTEQTAINQ